MQLGEIMTEHFANCTSCEDVTKRPAAVLWVKLRKCCVQLIGEWLSIPGLTVLLETHNAVHCGRRHPPDTSTGNAIRPLLAATEARNTSITGNHASNIPGWRAAVDTGAGEVTLMEGGWWWAGRAPLW